MNGGLDTAKKADLPVAAGANDDLRYGGVGGLSEVRPPQRLIRHDRKDIVAQDLESPRPIKLLGSYSGTVSWLWLVELQGIVRHPGCIPYHPFLKGFRWMVLLAPGAGVDRRAAGEERGLHGRLRRAHQSGTARMHLLLLNSNFACTRASSVCHIQQGIAPGQHHHTQGAGSAGE